LPLPEWHGSEGYGEAVYSYSVRDREMGLEDQVERTMDANPRALDRSRDPHLTTPKQCASRAVVSWSCCPKRPPNSMRLASREGGDDRSAFGASGLDRSFVDGPNWRPCHSAQLREVFGAPLTPCALASHGAMNGAHECERLRRFPLLRVRRCRAASSPAWQTSSAPEQSHAAPSLITSPYRRQSVTSGPGGPAIREPSVR
jgi:hypothetical protein